MLEDEVTSFYHPVLAPVMEALDDLDEAEARVQSARMHVHDAVAVLA
jgi:hypothetical protein